MQVEFRRELADILQKENLPEPNWELVLKLLASVLNDCPLEFSEPAPKIELTVAPGWTVTFKTEQAPARQRRRHCPPASPVR